MISTINMKFSATGMPGWLIGKKSLLVGLKNVFIWQEDAELFIADNLLVFQ
jgi:hypothetical protein